MHTCLTIRCGPEHYLDVAADRADLKHLDIFELETGLFAKLATYCFLGLLGCGKKSAR
jgi:hypothetical protein